MEKWCSSVAPKARRKICPPSPPQRQGGLSRGGVYPPQRQAGLSRGGVYPPQRQAGLSRGGVYPPQQQLGHPGGGVWGVLIWAPPPRGDVHPPLAREYSTESDFSAYSPKSSATTLGSTTPLHSEGVSCSKRARCEACPPYFAGVREPRTPPTAHLSAPWRCTTPVTPPRRGAESPCAAYERVPARSRVTTGRARETGTLHAVMAAASVIGGGGAAVQCRTRALAQVSPPRVAGGFTMSIYGPAQAAVPRRAAYGAHGAASGGAESDRRCGVSVMAAACKGRGAESSGPRLRTEWVGSLRIRSIDLYLVIKNLQTGVI